MLGQTCLLEQADVLGLAHKVFDIFAQEVLILLDFLLQIGRNLGVLHVI